MNLTDKRILGFIREKYKDEDLDLNKFLNPSFDALRDANKFKDIEKAVSRIKNAIDSNENILIYGDYDADGITSVTILYLHLKSLGANVNVFVPNRFENGYGISIDAIEEILASDFIPSLIITVDLGITAVEEVEILKQEGIEVIVTDHHLPLQEVPDCIIIDPKYNNEEYGFDGLCGAGVAMKMVEAISGREQANKYLDIAAIATIGDIVPLVDENRAIVKLGLDKINSGECLVSLTFLKDKLAIEKINSFDVSFKITPRLNACGRMDSAMKVFEFLIETDIKLLEQKYAEIESDNTLRLAAIDKGNKLISKALENYDISEPTVLVSGDFHEGTIGILASRICNEYKKPTIIFAKTENGTLKGSGRSIENIDLHKIISGLSDMLVNFGGHKMAIGVEIEENLFEKFKSILNRKILETSKCEDFIIAKNNYDIEITDGDISENFINQLELLEPFGVGNEKPVLMLREQDMNVVPISDKTFKHYRCFTKNNNAIVGFNLYDDVEVLKSPSKKELIVDLGFNYYRGKPQINSVLKETNVIDPDFANNTQNDYLAALYNKYYSIFDFNNTEKYFCDVDIKKVIKSKFKEDEFGTVVIATTDDDLKIVKELNLQEYFSCSPYNNGQNVVVTNPKGIYELSKVKSYKNIIFLHHYFDEEHLYFSQKLNVYEGEKLNPETLNLSKERDIFGKIYKLAINFAALKANDILDFAQKLSIKDTSVSVQQILFSIIVFLELNFLEFDTTLFCLNVLKSKKLELSSSKFYNIVG